MSLRLLGLTLVIVLPMTLPRRAMTAVEWALRSILSPDLLLMPKGSLRRRLERDEVNGGGVPGHVTPARPSRCRDVLVREVRDDDEPTGAAFREKLDEPPDMAIAALELSLLGPSQDHDPEVALPRARAS